ncbi:MAG: hypothetical protein QOG74_3303 [Alphaproteobacteria bacterium]|nr:hypothetical protein [Alphaproteobacteria bacterium]
MLKILTYDTAAFGLREWVQGVLGTRDLALLHLLPMHDPKGARVVKPSQRVYWTTTRLKQAFRGAPEARVAAFVREVVVPEIAYEPLPHLGPNFRLHEHGTETTSALHRDRQYHHRTGMMKIWMPITPVSGGGTLWVESREGRGDLRPMQLAYGQALLFDSLNLLHGCRFNDSGSTRVSIDFMMFSVAAASRPAGAAVADASP